MAVASALETGTVNVPKIVQQGDGYWSVQILLSFEELKDNRRLLQRTSQLKNFVSDRANVPRDLLRYDRIIERVQSDSGVMVTVRIAQIGDEAGEPVIRFSEMVGDDGYSYPDMQAKMTIFPIDTLKNCITVQRVMDTIRNSGAAMDLVDADLIQQKVSEACENKRSLKDIPIAQGEFPETGNDAKIEFLPTDLNEKDILLGTELSCHVKPGEIICRLIAATLGSASGRDAKGHEIAPQLGKEIILYPQKGIVISDDKSQAIADNEGLLTVRLVQSDGRISNGHKSKADSLYLEVCSVMTITGEEVVDMSTDLNVEVTGDLRSGSKIMSEGKVLIAGSVQKGTSIACNDLTIHGDVDEGNFSSNHDVIVKGSASNAEIVAKNDVVVGQDLLHCKVVGTRVTARHVEGCEIVARNDLILESLDAGNSGTASTISVGKKEYLQTKCDENRWFLDHTGKNLERIGDIVGKQVMNTITHTNVRQQWGEFYKKLQKRKDQELTEGDLLNLLTLFQNIPTLRTMMQIKNEETQDLEKQLEEDIDEDALVIVHGKVAKSQEITLNGALLTLEATENGARMESLEAPTSKNVGDSEEAEDAAGAQLLKWSDP
jgi:uncharacterized protein (DUF342 family)